MSDQADVRSIEALKDMRVALALFGDDALGALGGVEMEVKRTVQWLQHDRREYWQQQIKRRREDVATARAEVFRRKLAKTADYTPAFSEQKELLRKAEVRLADAELRAGLVKKWEPALQQAVLEYHGSIRRIKDLASGEVPRAVALLSRMVDAIESYLAVAVPTMGPASAASLGSIAAEVMATEPELVEAEADEGETPPGPVGEGGA